MLNLRSSATQRMDLGAASAVVEKTAGRPAVIAGEAANECAPRNDAMLRTGPAKLRFHRFL